MTLKEFLHKRDSKVHVGYVCVEGITYEDIKDKLPPDHINIQLITHDGIFGLSAIVKQLWEMSPPDIQHEMGGFIGKVIKSLYPKADIPVEPYPEIGGPIVYHAIAYIMDRVAQSRGLQQAIWIFSEFPLDENNLVVQLLDTISDMDTRMPHHIIALSDKTLSRWNIVTVNLQQKPDVKYPDDHLLKLLRQIALISLSSYGYALKKTIQKVVLTENKSQNIYKALIKQGYIEEWGPFIRFLDRRLYRYLLNTTTDKDIHELIQKLNFNTPGVMYLKVLLYAQIDDKKLTLHHVKKYIHLLKRRRMYRTAHMHVTPLIRRYIDDLDRWIIQEFLYTAVISEHISDLEISLVRKLLTYGKISPKTVFMLSFVYSRLPRDIQISLKKYIDNHLKVEYKIQSTLLALAMLQILYTEKRFDKLLFQRYTLYIQVNSFSDPEISARSCITRSRINLAFGRHTEALKQIERGIETSQKANIPWHLGILYNNLFFILRANPNNSADLTPLIHKAYETKFLYSMDNAFIPFSNYIEYTAMKGKKYQFIENIWTSFKPLMKKHMNPKDQIAVMWALGILYLYYDYKDKVQETLHTMKTIIDNNKNIPPNYISLYHNIAALYYLTSGEKEKGMAHLRQWKTLLGDKHDVDYEFVKSLADAMFKGTDDIDTTSFQHIFYSSLKTGKYTQGINLMQEHRKKQLIKGELAMLMKLEYFLGLLHKEINNIPEMRTHMWNAWVLSLHMGARTSEDIAQYLNIDTAIANSKVLSEMANMYLTQLTAASMVTLLSSSNTVHEILKKFISYLLIPASNIWALVKINGDKYHVEYSLLQGIATPSESYFKKPRTIMKSKKHYELKHLPSYIYIKKSTPNIHIILYAENRYVEKVFSDKDLARLNIWIDTVLPIIENTHLGEKAIMDSLTNVYTRWYIFQILGREIALSQREKTPLSLLFIDIDDFKRINDSFGHLVGDKVLKEIASTIKNNVRSTDYTGRYGGEEFIVVLPDTREDEAKVVAKRIIQTINEKENIPTTVSIGISTFIPQPGTNVTMRKLIRQADRAMYYAKKMGKNRIIHHHDIKHFES